MPFPSSRHRSRLLVALSLALGGGAWAQALTPQQQRFHAIYKELVEINTTHSAGGTTTAARAMEKRLLDAGFAAGDVQVIEPFPNKGNLVLRFKGDGSRKPLLLLAHLDVVEARREDWKTDPFKLDESGGYFTARGSIDDKAMASAFVAVLGDLKAEGFKPSRDIILALTADEERGDVPSNGALWLVNNRPELIRAEFGINEAGTGGGELRDGKPNLNNLQVAEKITVTYEVEAQGAGGHSSVPKADNAIYRLAGALQRLGAYQFPLNVGDVTRAYFDRSAAFATGQLADDMRTMASGHPDAAVVERMAAIPDYNALLRTTCVATVVQAGSAPNALPASAKATVNCRILPQDDPGEVDRQLRQVLGGDRIAVRALNKALPSPASPLNGDLVQSVEAVTQQMWPGVPVVPIMSTGATDSRYLRNAGIPMYGVTGMFLDPADTRAHGPDERIETARLYDVREFFYRLISRLAGGAALTH
ncbi:M20/M25/M40 family metallo-hydrolase [Variovorax sp.]|uniref:M20/M25/M40 family metallo-hydrolase n=1 Tax=Variovorax sp. TaxID=1871043 RepID=UPI002D45D006|nr:M20/M25/M40 family metallo-hydrolase [Variovorax sp.]HYP85042.1 M20/M25/M40 family metallo-hydrolase [Variovorax sp.]